MMKTQFLRSLQLTIVSREYLTLLRKQTRVFNGEDWVHPSSYTNQNTRMCQLNQSVTISVAAARSAVSFLIYWADVMGAMVISGDIG